MLGFCKSDQYTQAHKHIQPNKQTIHTCMQTHTYRCTHMSVPVLKVSIRSWSVIIQNRHFTVDYQWLHYRKCTVKYVLPNWIWSVIYQNGSENNL